MHEAALAVLRMAPERFWSFSAALFAAKPTSRMAELLRSPHAKRTGAWRASRLGAGIDYEAVLELLRVPEVEGHHAGNAVTGDLKVITRMTRSVGVHVTPTLMLDSVVQSQMDSTWMADQWIRWLKETVAVADDTN